VRSRSDHQSSAPREGRSRRTDLTLTNRMNSAFSEESLDGECGALTGLCPFMGKALSICAVPSSQQGTGAEIGSSLSAGPDDISRESLPLRA
jgi:hypothetical protein